MYLNDYTKLSTPPKCGKNIDPNCPSCCPDYANVGSSNIRPNHPDPDYDCPDKCDIQLVHHNPLHIYLIKYAVQGELEKFIGQAYVMAHNIKEAQCVFGTQSCFNGFRERLKITSMFEVPPCPEPVLVQEDNVAIIDRRNLNSYPFLTKSEWYKYINTLEVRVREVIDSYIKDKLDPIYNRLDALEERADTIENRLDGIDNTLEVIREDITNIENRLDNIDESIENIENDITTINTHLDNIDNSITSINNTLEAHSDRMDAMDDRMDDLQSQINADDDKMYNHSFDTEDNTIIVNPKNI